jgi:hypothetical protein
MAGEDSFMHIPHRESIDETGHKHDSSFGLFRFGSVGSCFCVRTLN